MNKKIILLPILLLSSLINTSCSKHEHSFVYKVTPPNKTIYLQGQDFDSEGLLISGTCSSCEHEEIISDYEIVNGDNLLANQSYVTININEDTVSVNITVKSTYNVVYCGDSLTQGHSWPNDAYTNFINDYTDYAFNNVNCGRNGISVTGYGGSWNDPAKRYQLSEYYTNSINANPDVVVLFLGTNDATGWANASSIFESRYKELINSYISTLGNKTKFIMMVSPPTTTNSFNIPNDKIRDYVNPIQRSLATEYDMELIDLRNLFESNPGGYTNFLKDGVHFTKTGSQFVAEKIAKVLEKI